MASSTLRITVGGEELPLDGLTGLARSDELLWSESTGRAAGTGEMVGSVVAAKQTYTLTWGGLVTEAQRARILSVCGTGFSRMVVEAGGATVADITAYRSNVAGDLASVSGGTAWWSGLTVQMTEV